MKKLNAVVVLKSGTSTTSLRAQSLTIKLGKGVVMKLARIKPGKFVMGSPKTEEGRRGDEGPLQQITITKPFYMGVTEVTQQQYAAVTGEMPGKDKGPSNPVTHVSFEMCQAFCEAMSKMTKRRVSMPNDALWEYACRAGTQSPFSFKGGDDDLGSHAWFKDNSDHKIHPVGQKKPNAWGLYDMHGNVWERCSAWISSPQAASIDPTKPNIADVIVVRGGSINDPAKICRSACTFRSSSGSQVGFRVMITSN